MNEEFKPILDSFYDPEMQRVSEIYLRKYWLPEEEWLNYWQPLKDSIFCPTSRFLPDLMFNEDFSLKVLLGGIVFGEKYFYVLKKCMIEMGEEEFVIVENDKIRPIIDKGDIPLHMRFKFPVDISWSELSHRNKIQPDIASELFISFNKEFFVFGNSGKWGMYAANDYTDSSIDPAGTPLNIVGCKPESALIFNKYINPSKKDIKKIRNWIPDVYRGLVNLW